jgi:peptide/nickel transport system substrate-binding protein
MKIFYPDGPVWMLAEPLLGGGAVEAAAFDTGPSSPEFIAAFDNWVENSSSIIVIDDYTIRFRLAEPYPPFIAAMTYEVGAIMSPSFAIKHATNETYANWEGYGVDYGEFENYMSDHMCGTGPYMLTDWVPDQFVELDLYTEYWRTSSMTGAGSLHKIFIKTNEDVNGRSLNLRTGRTDGCYWPTTNALDIWDPVEEESLDANIVVSTLGASFSVMFFGINMGDYNVSSTEIITSPFANKDFRQAASWAFDYDAFMSAAVNGFGIQAKGPIPFGMFGYNDSSYNFEYNLTAAVAAWNLALTDTDFINSMNALDNTLTIYYNSGNTVREQGSLLLADGLGNMTAHADADDQLAAGMDAEMTFTTQALEWSNYLDHIRNRQMPIFFVGWAPDYADPDNYVYPFCYHLGTYAGRIAYNNTAVNALYLQAKAEANLAQRKIFYNQINDILAEDSPYLWVYQSTEFRTWRAWLDGDGLVYNPMHQIYFYHVFKNYT